MARRQRPDAHRRRRRRRDAVRAQGRSSSRRPARCRRSTPTNEPEEWGVILDADPRRARRRDPGRWTRVAEGIRGVSEETTTGVHRLYQMMEAGHAALPRHQRQRLGDQEQVRQHLRLPPLAARRPEPRDRRDARRQGRRRARLRRGRQGLRAGAARPGLPRRSSPRSTRSARCRRRWKATRSTTLEDVVETADIFITATGNMNIITVDAHGADEGQGDRRQHRPLRQRDRHGRPEEDPGHRDGSTSSRSTTSGASPTATA